MLPGGQGQQFIDAIAVGLWHQDWTPARARLDAFARQGVTDYEIYLHKHPDALDELLVGVRTLALNAQCRAVFACLDESGQGRGPDSLAAVLPPATRAVLVPDILAILDGARRRERDVVAVSGTGQDVTVRLTLHALDTPDPDLALDPTHDSVRPGDAPPAKQISVLATVRDLSESQGLRDRVRSLDERLRRSFDDLEQFTYAASHDLQEPLRMVASYAQLLDRRYRGALDTRAEKYLEYIVEGAKRMQAQLGGLLDLSRIGDARITQEHRQPVDMTEVLANVAMASQSELDACAGAITAAALPTVPGYRLLLQRLLLHLVDNSIKFRSPERPLRIAVSAERTGADWLFTVADNGIGIDDKNERDVFVIFRRLHKRGEYPGIGMGLALAKKIVECHDGRIWVDNQVHRGATICFTLPGDEVSREKNDQ